MIDRLEATVDDVASLNSKLVLLIGPPRSGKSTLLRQLAKRRGVDVVSVGAALGRQLLVVAQPRRPLLASELLYRVVDEAPKQDVLLLDNIELLFDRSLQLNPLDILGRFAHSRRVVAVWPGELSDNRLCYAVTGHSEYREYGVDRLIPFRVA